MEHTQKNKQIGKFVLLGIVFFVAVLLSSCSCNRDKKDYERDIAQSKLDSLAFINVKIDRYEKDLFGIPIDSLKPGLISLSKKYSFFYVPEDLDDPMNILAMKQYRQDPTIMSLYNEVMKQYPSLAWLEMDMSMMFRRIKYFIPDWKIPQVYTYVSGGDIEFPVKYADNTLVIALDMFLGQKYPLYDMWGLPQYITNRMSKEYLLLSCATEIARAQLEQNGGKGKSLLDRMMYEGKMLYFCDVVTKDVPDSVKIGYSAPQFFWAEKNQGNVWGFFIEKKLLHTTEFKDINKFVGEAPFTSAFSKNSAPRVGRYIGWQIVRAYMSKNQQVTLTELFKNSNSQEILNKSGYKPEKVEKE
ncbi:MAG: hypothetical protein CVU11_03240 [Bacteroidetes bacterium HGW-Bacteroidetes-6]|jgi:hypothetical protein|nr:MAG: hypothetical protein CVU11_03240 [Bacteroidetes bacterium HGW-Bacteroidetes-6]